MQTRRYKKKKISISPDNVAYLDVFYSVVVIVFQQSSNEWNLQHNFSKNAPPPPYVTIKEKESCDSSRHIVPRDNSREQIIPSIISKNVLQLVQQLSKM